MKKYGVLIGNVYVEFGRCGIDDNVAHILYKQTGLDCKQMVRDFLNKRYFGGYKGNTYIEFRRCGYGERRNNKSNIERSLRNTKKVW